MNKLPDESTMRHWSMRYFDARATFLASMNQVHGGIVYRGLASGLVCRQVTDLNDPNAPRFYIGPQLYRTYNGLFFLLDYKGDYTTTPSLDKFAVTPITHEAALEFATANNHNGLDFGFLFADRPCTK